MFGSAKPLASLSGGLLARKGGARPAMRPQGYASLAPTSQQLEDLGWDDMGHEPQHQAPPQLSSVPADKAAPLARYAATIQSQRGDYNGRILSIRQEDLRSLAVIYDASPSALTEQLIDWGVLSSDARRALEV